jgi:hypothetical protein
MQKANAKEKDQQNNFSEQTYVNYQHEHTGQGRTKN